ncbi:polyphosphate kinase 1 [Celerinatantimonas diazotrophica]|uniref:Polyphosphate kinase n=1 Tax=Celerinatantimonas diazotrophica TaxID=412034 RepID=A0A4R1JLL0_9GAMM|nr:polyphosphate kinase 1 [Celerinatantimonas diazotrophica]TCK51926.1 polyphosphate kinase [Celerinatantimonas diazotrophica]CAG9296377.1 Polyphosphate kinase [Celerinatantimonas diazotrophica]
MSDEKLFLEKELSWLSFNERVLQEAQDKSVPLIERMRFLGIFSSNQDEFFKVRVADVKRRILLNKYNNDEHQGAKHLLTKIQNKTAQLDSAFDETYRELIIALVRRNIFLINETQLSLFHQQWLTTYFQNKILRHITPIIITHEINLLDFLKDDHTYLAVKMANHKNNGEPTNCRYALIEIPTDDLPRFVVLPAQGSRKKKSLMILDNIIRFGLDKIFSGFFQYDEISAYSIKMTRDAEYDLTDEVDLSLLEAMSESLKQRLTAEPVRFVYDEQMPADLLELLKQKLHISSYDHIRGGGRYHSFKDLMSFPNVGRKYLEHPKLPALNSALFDRYTTAFKAISAQDILLYYPYQKFSYLSELVRQASFDPNVQSIKINIYRVASNSRIMHSLIEAAHNGKRVTVVVELRARFDEQANIEWAQQLTDAGVRVVFGLPSLKIHSKLLLINRTEEGKTQYYAHIGTGNFHEKTAKIYTDFALFTKNQEISEEVNNVFKFIERPYRRYKFNHLILSPIDSRRRLYSLIDHEIRQANAQQKAAITVKVNNLVDVGLINRLYAASKAGVKIRMIVRGMCSLLPGIEGLSENISIISIVDRFLEHPRVFIFHAAGEEKTFISSADWMTRNIDQRIEVGCPIYDPDLKQYLHDLLALQFSDTTKARIIDKTQSNQYVKRGNRRKIRSQITTYEFIKEREKVSCSSPIQPKH